MHSQRVKRTRDDATPRHDGDTVDREGPRCHRNVDSGDWAHFYSSIAGLGTFCSECQSGALIGNLYEPEPADELLRVMERPGGLDSCTTSIVEHDRARGAADPERHDEVAFSDEVVVEGINRFVLTTVGPPEFPVDDPNEVAISASPSRSRRSRRATG